MDDSGFWAMTKYSVTTKGTPADELDIVEAYGPVGKGRPNHPGYSITSHFWKQSGPEGNRLAISTSGSP